MMRFLFLTPALATAFSSPPPGSMSVWDDVLPREQRAALHDYASRSGLEHKCFSRPLVGAGHNVIERTLDALLTEIEDGRGTEDGGASGTDAGYVEYWTRQEWRSIEAHADVDEHRARRPPGDDDDDALARFPATYEPSHGHRYPVRGHVLYLQVGSDVRGPTCVFPRRGSGGDLLRPAPPGDGGGGARDVRLVTVPAVAGRLLRFDGRDLHAVPRPHDLWMLPFVRGGAEDAPAEAWGRSVVLFNAWPAGEEPPLDVPLDVGGCDGEGRAPGDRRTTNAPWCTPFVRWKEIAAERPAAPPTAGSREPNQSVKVWLLGDERRREHPLRTVPLVAPAEGGRGAVREALAEPSRVTELWLRQQ